MKILVVTLLAALAADATTNRYDDQFRIYSREYLPVIDWRWLRSQCWAESSLRPDAVSPVGAVGLCQFMQGTWGDVMPGMADEKRRDARWSIAAAAKYNRQLWDTWTEKRSRDDRRRIVFASYNAGIGNILKAQKKARADNKRGNSWEEISRYLEDVTGHHHKETLGYVDRIERHFPSPDSELDLTSRDIKVKSNSMPVVVKVADTSKPIKKESDMNDSTVVAAFTLLDQVQQGGVNVGYLLAGLSLMLITCLLYTSPSPRDRQKSRMPSSA